MGRKLVKFWEFKFQVEIGVSNGGFKWGIYDAFCNMGNNYPPYWFQISVYISVSNGNKNIGFKHGGALIKILLDRHVIDIFIGVCKGGIHNSCN